MKEFSQGLSAAKSWLKKTAKIRRLEAFKDSSQPLLVAGFVGCFLPGVRGKRVPLAKLLSPLVS
jgi:hypothetical protein